MSYCIVLHRPVLLVTESRTCPCQSTMLSYFNVIPHEVAVQCCAADLHRHDVESFCHQMVLGAVSAATIPDTTINLPRRAPLGRPLGSFNVQRFALSLVSEMVEKKMVHSAGPVVQQRKTYRKRHPDVQELALEIAAQRKNDAATVSFLAMLFPKTMGHMRPSHLHAFRVQQQKRVDGVQRKAGPGLYKCPTPEALADIVACINAHVGASLEFTTAEMRSVCLVLLEERHPMLLVKGFKISESWLNKLMRETLQLPMRRTITCR